MINIKKMGSCFLLFLVIFGLARAHGQQPLGQAKKGDAAFSQKQEQLIQHFEKQRQPLQAQLQALDQEIAALPGRIRQSEKQRIDGNLILNSFQKASTIIGFGLTHFFSCF